MYRYIIELIVSVGLQWQLRVLRRRFVVLSLIILNRFLLSYTQNAILLISYPRALLTIFWLLEYTFFETVHSNIILMRLVEKKKILFIIFFTFRFKYNCIKQFISKGGTREGEKRNSTWPPAKCRPSLGLLGLIGNPSLDITDQLHAWERLTHWLGSYLTKLYLNYEMECF